LARNPPCECETEECGSPVRLAQLCHAHIAKNRDERTADELVGAPISLKGAAKVPPTVSRPQINERTDAHLSESERRGRCVTFVNISYQSDDEVSGKSSDERRCRGQPIGPEPGSRYQRSIGGVSHEVTPHICQEFTMQSLDVFHPRRVHPLALAWCDPSGDSEPRRAGIETIRSSCVLTSSLSLPYTPLGDPTPLLTCVALRGEVAAFDSQLTLGADDGLLLGAHFR
jgi:hypothetical protein